MVEETAQRKVRAESAHKPGTHYSVQELAAVWGLGVDKIRELFENEPDVIKLQSPPKKGKRAYVTLRIPEKVADRVQRRIPDGSRTLSSAQRAKMQDRFPHRFILYEHPEALPDMGCAVRKRTETYVRQPLKLRDWKEAQKIVRAWDERGTKPKSAAARTTIEALKDQFIENMKSVNRASATIKKYEVLFRQLVAFTQDKGLRFVNELDLAILEQFRATWKDGALSKSKKQERLRGVLRYALRHRIIEVNSALDLDRIKIVPAKVVPFTDEQLDRIWIAAKNDSNPRIYALALLMRFSGLRISDAVGLRIDQIKDGHLSLRTRKVQTDVSVPLPETVVRALHSFKAASATHFFWNGTADLNAVAGYHRDYYFSRVFTAAKIEGKPHPHQFRHTFASKLLSAGVSIVEVAALLGNSVKIC